MRIFFIFLTAVWWSCQACHSLSSRRPLTALSTASCTYTHAQQAAPTHTHSKLHLHTHTHTCTVTSDWRDAGSGADLLLQVSCHALSECVVHAAGLSVQQESVCLPAGTQPVTPSALSPPPPPPPPHTYRSLKSGSSFSFWISLTAFRSVVSMSTTSSGSRGVCARTHTLTCTTTTTSSLYCIYIYHRSSVRYSIYAYTCTCSS